ncbi:uncharacterized protein LOC135702095 [Ochlerotatus camptorhynchus]|uniref:uncharacterized protein LOC135702095 n=1 Tax=Ochlerotatus camptorhynchus TaxID=644619 RepID=UPI0031D329F8
MAANSGVKIFRDFLRDSPCRMAYMMTQQKNFTQQYAKNHHLGKSAAQERPNASRPKTAPIPPPSNLAQAITNHNLMPESVVTPKRPRTSARLIKPNLELMSTDGLLTTTSRRPPPQKPIRRPEVPRPSEQIRKRPSGSSVEDVRKRQQQQQKQSSSSKHHDREAPKRPCKICIGEDCFVPEQQQWQDLLNVTPSSSSSKSNGFRHLIGEIERIRSELTSRDGMKHIGLQQSLELINEIKQRFDSVRAASGGASYLNRLGPFQTADRRIKPRKSVRSLRFEGGRIVEKDYTKVHHRGGEEVLKAKKSKLKQVEKKFDEGPLRMLLPFMRGSLKAEKVRF